MRKFNINVNGKAYAVEVEEVGGVANNTPVVANIAPVANVAAAPVAVGSGTPVNAPMPGLVKKLCFANGAAVKENDQILIVEAMKMDTPIVAPKAGVITYSTQPGANIDAGAVVCTIA